MSNPAACLTKPITTGLKRDFGSAFLGNINVNPYFIFYLKDFLFYHNYNIFACELNKLSRH